jgi:hypothetical protein
MPKPPATDDKFGEANRFFELQQCSLRLGRGSLQTKTLTAPSFPNSKVANVTLRERKSKIANPKSKMV